MKPAIALVLGIALGIAATMTQIRFQLRWDGCADILGVSMCIDTTMEETP